MKKKIISWLGFFPILAIGLTLLLISQRQPLFATWYATYIYPVFPRTIGWFWGLFPFSVFEILFVLVILLFIVGMVYFILCLFKRERRVRLKARGLLFTRRLLYLLASIFTVFVLTAGINYSRESYAHYVGIVVQDSSLDELIRLYMMLVERADVLSQQIEVDDYGHFVLGRVGLYDYASLSMDELNNLYGGLGWYFPRAKAPILSRLLLSNLNIGGFFSPWTLEAHYNGDMPATSIPFVINHELAHVSGHMREDEANFIAYLASRNSQNVDFQYSAVYTALNYILNALRRVVSSEEYSELFAKLPEQVKRDFAYAWAYWQTFQGPVADMQVRINDAYLRLNQQEDGVQSYGRMVDLLLAYYRN